MKRIALFVPFLVLSMATPARSLPLIQEVFYDAPGADAPHVFTEIFGIPGEILDGWSLVGIDGGSGLPYRTIDLSGSVVPADGLLLLATARAIGELLSLRDLVADVDWQNGPDAIVLRNPFGETVDALQYGEAGERRVGEGLPAPDPPPGFSLTRDARSTDTNENARDFAVAEPTPGRRAFSVREPPTGPFFLAGGLGLLLRWRRGVYGFSYRMR
jgi:hypothetical protein